MAAPCQGRSQSGPAQPACSADPGSRARVCGGRLPASVILSDGVVVLWIGVGVEWTHSGIDDLQRACVCVCDGIVWWGVIHACLARSRQWCGGGEGACSLPRSKHVHPHACPHLVLLSHILHDSTRNERPTEICDQGNLRVEGLRGSNRDGVRVMAEPCSYPERSCASVPTCTRVQRLMHQQGSGYPGQVLPPPPRTQHHTFKSKACSHGSDGTGVGLKKLFPVRSLQITPLLIDRQVGRLRSGAGLGSAMHDGDAAAGRRQDPTAIAHRHHTPAIARCARPLTPCAWCGGRRLRQSRWRPSSAPVQTRPSRSFPQTRALHGGRWVALIAAGSPCAAVPRWTKGVKPGRTCRDVHMLRHVPVLGAEDELVAAQAHAALVQVFD